MEKIHSQPLIRVLSEKGKRATRWLRKCSDCTSIDDFKSKMDAIAGAQSHIYDEHSGRGSIVAGSAKHK